MKRLTGYMNRPTAEKARIHDKVDPATYREIDVADIVDITVDHDIVVVSLSDDAPEVGGGLSDEEFATLFMTGGRPTREFFRRSSYPDCYTWAPPGEIAIC